jgi:hypothetical protein
MIYFQIFWLTATFLLFFAFCIKQNNPQESYALQSIMMIINYREEVEGIIDPGSQIIAMSEAVFHDIGLAYDLFIKLNMQSANGKVDQSLGLSCNVP